MYSRELWLLAAVYGFTLCIMHKPGVSLILADALSRAHMDAQAKHRAAMMCDSLGLVRVCVHHTLDRFTQYL